MVYLAPFAEQHGMSTLTAASLVGLVGGANATGRLVLGALAARWNALALYRACFIVLGLGLVVWLVCHGRYDYLVGFALLLGTAHGGWTTLLPAVTAQLYGTRGLGRTMGTLHTGGGFGCLVGPPVAGAVIDLTGGYGAAIVASAALVFGSWVLLRPLKLRFNRREARGRVPGGTAWTSLRTALRTWIRALAAEPALRRVIHELEGLDDHRLRDLGLTRGNIEQAVRCGRPMDVGKEGSGSLGRAHGAGKMGR
jgi:MFS family permease